MSIMLLACANSRRFDDASYSSEATEDRLLKQGIKQFGESNCWLDFSQRERERESK